MFITHPFAFELAKAMLMSKAAFVANWLGFPE
jgi:hypothetical protein